MKKIKSIDHNSRWSKIFQYLPEIGLGSLVIVVLIINIAWIHTDSLLGPEGDSKIYFIKTLGFISRLNKSGLDHILESVQIMSMMGRPPLYQLLSIPFMLLLGHSIDSGLMLNLFFQVLLLVSVYSIGKILSNPRAGFLAAVLVSVYPPLVQLSRIYLPYYALGACVAFSLWLLFLLLKNYSVKIAWYFIFSLGFGALIHPIFVKVLILPVALILIYLIFKLEPNKPAGLKDMVRWIWKKLTNRLLLLGLFPSIILVVGIVGLWYFTSGMQLLELSQFVNSDNLAEFRGFDVYTRGFHNIPKGFFWHFLTMPFALSYVLAILFFIGFITTSFKHREQDLILVVTFIGVYIPFAFSSTKTWMQSAGLLPIIAIITAIWLSELKMKWLSTLMISLTLVVGVFVFSVVNWGVNGVGYDISRFLGAPLDKLNFSCQTTDLVFCPTPASSEDWRIDELLSMVVNDPDCIKNQCNLLVLYESPNFQKRTFLYYQRINFSASHLNIRHIQPNLYSLSPFDFTSILKSNYIIFGDSKPSIQSEINYNLEARLFLNSPPESFAASHSELTTIKLPRNITVRLLKRDRPLLLEEAEDTIQAINLPEKYKTQQYQVLAPLYRESGEFEKAIYAYTKAIKYAPTNENLFLDLAEFDSELRQDEEAIEMYQMVIEIDPDNWKAQRAKNKMAEIFFNLATEYKASGQDEEAIEMYQKVIELLPESELARKSEAQIKGIQQ